ncbi:MAG: two-component system, sensor histidine kinase and response regulator [Bacteroidales bacterium]|nr:two-component system, sensor histidine kinase and response regulator [Bacteroidales bacterium]
MSDKVLIIDDSLTNNVLLENVLKSANIESLVAYNGKEALKIVEKEKPSLILLDIMMPEMDGFMFLEKIKNNDLTKNISVIIITAKDDEESIYKAQKTGVQDFILKPIDIKMFLESVTKQLAFNKHFVNKL